MDNRHTISALCRKVCSVLAVSCMAAGLFACSSVQYVDNHDLKYLQTTRPGVASEHGKQFGALHFKGKAEDGSEDRYFALKKHRNIYGAETLMFDNSGRTSAQFERAYMSVGADYKKRFFGLQLRFEY